MTQTPGGPTGGGEPTLLGGRYEVGELLGRGGMAEVRKGTDIRLGRVVAIKRLRGDLVDDPTFQSRFRREAQSAASLNHPAIAAVYDTGEDVGPDGHPHPYIVMEYVPGRTLRDILREGRRILPERALEIVSGVLSALDYSHRAGIIHRDIKPANVMLTPAGDVKVMDFGIARALADTTSTMTQTAAVVGTAQYLSPEQARGEMVDFRSDVYSTGCLLYELLTGRPPFVGDSPVAVAYQHVREAAQPPSSVDHSIPPEVDAIVMKALAKPIDERYQSAAAMRADIERYLAGKPIAAPAPAMVPPIAPLEPSEATTMFDQADDEEPPRKKWPLVLLGVVIVALLGAAVAFGMEMFNSDPERAEVPRITGLTVAQAEAALEARELKLGDQTEEPSPDVPEGQIISQDPGPLERVVLGTEVNVVVSTGPEEKQVPFLIGMDKDEARAQLRAEGWKVRMHEQDKPGEANTVIATDPVAGTMYEVGKVIHIYWATGPIQVPNVVGQNIEDATRMLTDAGFKVATVNDSTTVAEAGEVLSQTPGPKTKQPKGTTIVLTVSTYVPPPPPPTETPTPTPSETPSPTPPNEEED